MSFSGDAAPAEAAPAIESLDVVDDHNQPVETAPRDDVHARGLKHRSAHIAIFDARGRLLIQKRASSKKILPDHWDISSAGHLNPGEEYLEGARRELFEELKLDVPLRLVTVTEADERTGHEFAALFVGQVWLKRPQPDPGEIAEIAWVELPELCSRFANPGFVLYCGSLVNMVLQLVQRPHLLPKAAQHTLERARLDVEEAREAAAAEGRTEEAAIAGRHTPLENLERQQLLQWPGTPSHEPSVVAVEAAANRAPMPRLVAGLERALRVLLVAAMLGAIMAFPLGLDSATLGSLTRQWGPANPEVPTWLSWFYITQIHPFLASALDPLTFKETVVSLIAGMILPLFALLILLRPGERLLHSPWVLLLGGFVVYAALGVVFVIPRESLFMGIYTLTRLAAGGLLVAATVVAVRHVRHAQAMVILAAVPLAFLAFVALLQHFEWPTVFPAFSSIRQRMAATIGHNNGVAGALVFAWFPALAGLLMARSMAARVAFGAAVGLLAFIFLALQTRGIWVVLAVLTPVFLYLASRVIGLHLKLRFVLLAVVLVMLAGLLQSIDSPANLFRGKIPLVERLGDLTPEKLRTTTQRRILVAALHYMPLDASRYALGEGLGSFAWIYPEMQASYFSKHSEDTDVLLTGLRTLQAHSDVLQLFIETGLVGLSFFLLGLFMLARHMERTLEATRDPRHRLLLLVIFFPVLGTIIHGLGDFPFHVMSTATLFCVFLGLTLAAPRVFAAGGAPLPRRTGLQRLVEQQGTSASTARLLLLVSCLLLFVPMAALASQNLAYMAATTLRRFAVGALEQYALDPALRNSPAGNDMITQVRADLQGAFRLFPADPETLRYRAQFYQLMAEDSVNQWQRLVEQQAPAAEIDAWRERAMLHTQAMLHDLDAAHRNGLRYHVTVHLEAVGYQFLTVLDPPNSMAHRTAFEVKLREAVRLNPAYAPALLGLIEMHEQAGVRHTDDLSFYRRQLRRFNWNLYQQRYQDRFDDAMYARRYAEALSILRIMQEDAPEEALYVYREAGVNANMGNIEQARRSLAEARRRFPNFEWADAFALVPEVKARNWPMVYRMADRLIEGPEERRGNEAYVRALRLFAAETVAPDRVEELRSDFDRRIERGGDPARELLDKAIEAMYLDFGDATRAAELVRRRLLLGGRMHPFFHVIAAEIAMQRNDMRTVEFHLIEGAAISPDDPLIRRAMADLARRDPDMVTRIREGADLKRRQFEQRNLEEFRRAQFGE